MFNLVGVKFLTTTKFIKEVLSPKGAALHSPGQRPGKSVVKIASPERAALFIPGQRPGRSGFPGALPRDKKSRHFRALINMTSAPRASPWAVKSRPLGAQNPIRPYGVRRLVAAFGLRGILLRFAKKTNGHEIFENHKIGF